MPSRAELDPVTRARLRAWLRFYKDARDWTNQRLADELGVSEPNVTMILNGQRTAGLDMLIKMHRRLHRSADDLLDTDPPKKK